MYDRTSAETMAQYNHWMNLKLYAVCAEMSDEQRREDRGAFFKSISGTLNHLLVGDRIWMGRFMSQPYVAQLRQELYSDFNELRQQREITDQQILEWSKQLTNDWLNQTLRYKSASDGVERVLPHGLLVIHLFNHQTHHRGQLTTLLSQLGYDLGVTDLPWMPTLNVRDGD
ncbi:MAG: DinB family protein [Timaviella obliquedivisa GSE-PSE-MK23-08B]|jgi:uncharacterized damage-inducible protein DinB|nr:DinB family protein [Timaviella obliquedivisa GSE-PSE-MK23-08B]